jgi:hypothetical protein
MMAGKKDFVTPRGQGTGIERSSDIPALNVILARWWRPLSGADSGGGG